MSNVDLLQARGIDLKRQNRGQIKTLCPKCSESRKNKKDPCLSVNIDDGTFNCHNCDFHGRVFEKKLKEYVRPAARLEKVGKDALKFFEDQRKISNNTLLRFGITEAKEWMPQFEKEVPVICFNYFRDDELVNIKFRGPKKSFKMAKDAELIFYNLDAIKTQDECIIVEGEMDCLALYEVGFFNVVSVPNGAGGSQLEYLDNCWQYFDNKSKVILMVDGDEAGYQLREELARRIGKERCFKVVYPEGCKDANDVLIKQSAEALKEVVKSAVQWPMEGIHSLDDLLEDVVNFYYQGYPQGCSTGIASLDEHITFMEGQLTIVTGIPGSGKSEVVDWIMTNLSKKHEWSWAICSFENQPASIHVTKLIEKFAGKSFAKRYDPSKRISTSELEYGVSMVDKYFHFINISQVDLTLTGILEKARELVKRKGVKGLLIDPWNYIEHKIPHGYTETQYISECLSEIKTFALSSGMHVFLIAHPTKIKKDTKGKYEIPTLYHISGSAHFFNKTDNGITIYRDFQTNQVDVYIQKIRFSWLGKIGFCSFHYNTEIRQYEAVGYSPPVGMRKIYPEESDVPFPKAN